MKKLLNLGNAIFFTMSVLWLYFAFRYAFEFLPLDLVNITEKPATITILVSTSIVVFICYYFNRQALFCLRGFYRILVTYKWFVLLLLTIFQIWILLTSGGLARSDTTILYQIVTDPAYAKETLYISNFPNNFLFLVYLKLVYKIAPAYFIFNLSLLNIFFVNASLLLSYHILKDYVSQTVRDRYFLLYVFLFAMQPQFIYTYTDPITLFFVVVMLAVMMYLVQEWQQKNRFTIASLLMGLSISVCYNLRPPTVIYIIALIIVLFAVKLRSSFTVKKIVLSILLALCTFGVSNAMTNAFLEKQNFVHYDDNYSRSLLYYVNLGLTYTGHEHHQIPQEIMDASEDRLDDLVKQDIRRRLDEYDRYTFIGHLYYKYYWITGEGMFGWNMEQVMSEETALKVSFIDQELGKEVRSYIYANGKNFWVTGILFQVVWIITVMGIVIYAYFFRPTSFHIGLWMEITLFGGFCFLMIFEGGRTRYLIQFLPAILLLSSLGWDQVFHLIQGMKRLKRAEETI